MGIETLLFVALGVGGGIALSKSMTAGGGVKMPVTAQTTKTAAPAPQTLTEEQDRKKRLAASILTKDWSLSLGKPALLGITNTGQ